MQAKWGPTSSSNPGNHAGLANDNIKAKIKTGPIMRRLEATNGKFGAHRVLMVNWAHAPEAKEAIKVIRAKNFMIKNLNEW